MKISVVTTLYRSAPYIQEFIERMRTELRKLTDDYEFILVDDGSPDDSLKTALALLPSEPGLWIMTGFKLQGVEFEKGSRGTTSYSMGGRLIMLLDSITSFSELPLFLVFYIGCAVLFISILMALILIFRRLQGHILQGWVSTM